MLNQMLHLIVGLVVIIPIPFGIMWVVMKWADMNESGMGYKGRYKKKENE